MRGDRAGDAERDRVDRRRAPKARLSQRQGAGLIEHHGIDLGQPLQRAAVLQQHATLEQPPRRRHLHHRHGKAERAGTGDDEHRDGNGDGAMNIAGGGDPAEAGQQRDTMHHRRVKPGGAVGDAPIGRAAALRRFH